MTLQQKGPSGAAIPGNLGISSPIPIATIKIDGKFDDWQNIEPIFLGASGAKGALGIDKVFLAEDSQNLYLKIRHSRYENEFIFS